MSPALRTEVSYQSCKTWVRRLPYFKNVSKLFLQDVTSHVKTWHFAQGETFGDNFVLYILKVGLVSWSKGQGKLLILRPGSVWGDEHLFLNAPELLLPNTVTTLTFAEVLSLDRKTFKGVCDDYPDYKARLYRYYLWYALVRTVVNAADKKRKHDAVRAQEEAVANGHREVEDVVNHHAIQAMKSRKHIEVELKKSAKELQIFQSQAHKDPESSSPLRPHFQSRIVTQDEEDVWNTNPDVAAASSAEINTRLTDLSDRLTGLDVRLSDRLNGLDDRLSKGLQAITARTTAMEDLIAQEFRLLKEDIGIAPQAAVKLRENKGAELKAGCIGCGKSTGS